MLGGDKMASVKITQVEADRLLKMLKRTLISEINFPTIGESVEFNVAGDSKQDIIAINIFRGKINRLKYNIGARIVKNGILLLELHINPSNVHPNPDGEKITGSHWHIYSEEYGRLWAFPAENIDSEEFIENTMLFLEKFNVIESPTINFQMELV